VPENPFREALLNGKGKGRKKRGVEQEVREKVAAGPVGSEKFGMEVQV